MRGKLVRSKQYDNPSRITPAHAGKTYALWAEYIGTPDHPRACGENTKKIL